MRRFTALSGVFVILQKRSFPIFGTVAVSLEPLGILQLGIGSGAIDHQFPKGEADNDISVHGFKLIGIVINAKRGNVHAVGVLGDSIDKRLRREGIFRLCAVLRASRATANADDLGLYLRK